MSCLDLTFRRYYGSEFINAHLYRYCRTHQLQFTRGRPYKKDDNAHIEQKNWTHVRKLMGYVRYDSEAARTAMNAVYADLRLLQNLFLPSVKLQRKERVGARLRRHYDAPQTPLARVRRCPQADLAKVAALVRQRDQLDPFALAARHRRPARAGVRVSESSARAGALDAGGRAGTRQDRACRRAPAPQERSRFGNTNNGATMRRSVTLTYGSTGSDRSLETVAKDIVQHFLGRGFQGKATVVSIDKATALRMHD